ncbi:MAG: YcxB family protein [Paracoccaceae bacterium]
MTQSEELLQFTLANYGHERAAKLMTSRLWSPVQRNSLWMFCVGLVLWLVGVQVWGETIWPVHPLLPILGSLALWVWLISVGVRKRKVWWEAVARIPSMSGPASVQIDSTGLTYATKVSRMSVGWVPGVDVIKAADGLLITLGEASYLPIPASAFENEAAQDAFLARAQTYVVPADGVFS